MPDVDPDEIGAPPACFRYPHCAANEACGWPECAEGDGPCTCEDMSGLCTVHHPNTCQVCGYHQ